MPITITNIAEETKRSIHSVIKYFFVGGNTRNINSIGTVFPDCNIVYDVRRLENTNTKPVIAILGSRRSSSERFKCDKGYRLVVNVERTVFIKVNDEGSLHDFNSTKISSSEYADTIWGLLTSVFETQDKFFSDFGIINPMIDPSPIEIPSEGEALLRGDLEFKINVDHKKDVNPI